LALLITIVIGTFGTFLITPALQHGYAGTFAHQAATDPRLQAMTPDQLQNVEAIGVKAVGFGWLFTVVLAPFASLIATVVLLIFDKIGHGEGSFAKYWGAACNIAIPSFALATIVSAIIVLARGADSFGTIQEVQQAMPTLASLLPGASVKLSAFLSAFSPFTLWGAGLNVAALRIIGKVGPVPAWIGAFALLIIPAAIASFFAR
jgi:hypothetical protein